MYPKRIYIFSVLALASLSMVACSPGTETQTISPPSQPPPTCAVFPTPSQRGVETACPSPVPIQPVVETASPSPTPEARQSVFVISWDGGRADIVYDLMGEGDMPGFAALARQGLRAEYAQTVDPPLTAVAQNSISTGSIPARTGIVSNSYHNFNDSFYWYRSGFDEVLDEAEPVWVTASRAGLTTAAVFFPGGSLAYPAQTADFTVGLGIRKAYSRRETVALAAAQDWQNLPASYSPPLEATYHIPEVTRIHMLVLDSTDDHAENYDVVLISRTHRVNEDTPRLGVGGWGSLILLPNNVSGADFLIQEITSEQVTFFHTGVYHNSAAPRELLEGINQRYGFFRSGADSYALEHGWITAEDNLYLIERASLWMAEVAAWVYATYHPDLIFTWQDTFDAAGHAFFLQDQRQLDYTSERAELYAEYYRHIGRVSDRALEIMIDDLDLRNTTVLLVGDHGMAPVHTTVYVNTILERAGLLRLDSRDYVVVEKSEAFAVASGGAVNVYLNLEDRERSGIVSPEVYTDVQQTVIDLLVGLTDPETGERVFQRVLRRDELASIGLDHPNSGDVFAQAEPGYHLDGWRGVDYVFKPSNFYGQHGYDSSLPEMRTLFIASGAGVPATGEVIPFVNVVDYAPTIAALLGFSPAPTVDGEIIAAILDR